MTEYRIKLPARRSTGRWAYLDPIWQENNLYEIPIFERE